MKTLRISIAAAAAVLAGCTATATPRVLPLSEVLTLWAAHNDVQLIIPKGRRCEIPAHVQNDSSLDAILAGTGVDWFLVNDRTVAIECDRGPRAPWERPPQRAGL